LDWEGEDRFLESGDVLAGPPGVHGTLLELAEAGPPAAPAADPTQGLPLPRAAPYIRRGRTVGEGSEGMEIGMSR
jgi:hypothetical protein